MRFGSWREGRSTGRSCGGGELVWDEWVGGWVSGQGAERPLPGAAAAWAERLVRDGWWGVKVRRGFAEGAYVSSVGGRDESARCSGGCPPVRRVWTVFTHAITRHLTATCPWSWLRLCRAM